MPEKRQSRLTEAERLRKKFPQSFAIMRQAMLAADKAHAIRSSEMSRMLDIPSTLSPSAERSHLYEISLIANLLLMEKFDIKDSAPVAFLKDAAKSGDIQEVMYAFSIFEANTPGKNVMLLDLFAPHVESLSGEEFRELLNDLLAQAEPIVEEQGKKSPRKSR